MGVRVTTFDFEPTNPYCLQIVVEEQREDEKATRRDAGTSCGLGRPSRFTIHQHLETDPSLTFFTNELSDGTGGGRGFKLSVAGQSVAAWHTGSPEENPVLVDGREVKVLELSTRSHSGDWSNFSVFVTLRPNQNAVIGSGGSANY
ncbi:MAG: hypothetical protein AAGG55_05485 [Pseudomonadota bacterium]